MFNALLELPFTVIIIWGWPGEPEEICIWPEKREKANLKKLRNVVMTWYKGNKIAHPESVGEEQFTGRLF